MTDRSFPLSEQDADVPANPFQLPLLAESGRSGNLRKGSVSCAAAVRDFGGKQLCIVLHGTARYATGVPAVGFKIKRLQFDDITTNHDCMDAGRLQGGRS